MSDFYPTRYICSVLNEMRECCKTLNFSYLGGLIEEAQTLANRMEAKLEESRDIRNAEERKEELQKELDALRKEIKERKAELEELGDRSGRTQGPLATGPSCCCGSDRRE